MLNVAVTRAKEVIYVVGNKSLWSEVGVFKELHDRINIAS
jgi:superfamily I DNA and/or RNA helicase